MVGDPVDLLVGGQESVPDVGDLHEPGRDCLVDDWRVGPPAVRVVVLVGVVADDLAGLLEVADDLRVGVEDVQAGPPPDLVGEPSLVVNRDHPSDRDAGGLADDLVVLAETGSHVDDAGAVRGIHEVGAQDPEGVGPLGEEVEHRGEGSAHQVASGERAHLGGVLQLGGVAVNGVGAQHEHRAVGGLAQRVGDVGPDGKGEVRWQGPWSGRPRHDPHGSRVAVGRCQVEGHRDRRVLAGTGGIVEADLEVGQRGLGSPGVRHYPVRLVDEALVPELLERPHDRLHVGEVHGLVVVLEVDPPGLPGDRLLPLSGVAEHRLPALGVEAADAVVDDVGPSGDREFLRGLHLGGQPVAVPAEPAVHPLAAHRPVAGDHVLHVAGEQVAVVGQAVGEWWAVEEDELVVDRAGLDGGAERALGLPAGQNPFLDGREVGPTHLGIRGGRQVGGVWGGGVLVAHGREQATGVPRGAVGRVPAVQSIAAPRSLSSNLRTLPLAFMGRASTTSTWRGAL